MHERWLMALTVAMMLCTPASVLAHGTDQPGPHGGEIRMPGAFHVEAVAQKRALRVYLLDMQFERPRVADSSVTVELEQDGRTMQLACEPAGESKAFVCPLPDRATLQRGTLEIDATRQGRPASTARYELPLAWQQKPSESAS